ncbi:DUF317 domain-containing protein [Streptomyces decoyicus]|uniref:DUF317 domain-containing protein n=1 Tax=Streptomyces decoyicus TaxID=249567 RepID=UPI00386355BF
MWPAGTLQPPPSSSAAPHQPAARETPIYTPSRPDLADNDADVLVSPRYLAGPRDCAFDIFTAPLSEHGWTFADDGHDTSLFTSPCLRIRVGWLPEVRTELPIQIAASTHPLRSPLWHISLDDSAPTEFLTAVTSTLARSLAESPHTLFAPNNDRAAALPRPRGWPGFSSPLVSFAQSADMSATYSAGPYVSPAGTPPEHQSWWSFAAGPQGQSPWKARFSTAAPKVLVEAFHDAFTDPAPLGRKRHELDPLLLTHLSITDPATSRTPGAPTGGRTGHAQHRPTAPRMSTSPPHARGR